MSLLKFEHDEAPRRLERDLRLRLRDLRCLHLHSQIGNSIAEVCVQQDGCIALNAEQAFIEEFVVVAVVLVCG